MDGDARALVQSLLSLEILVSTVTRGCADSEPSNSEDILMLRHLEWCWWLRVEVPPLWVPWADGSGLGYVCVLEPFLVSPSPL